MRSFKNSVIRLLKNSNSSHGLWQALDLCEQHYLLERNENAQIQIVLLQFWYRTIQESHSLGILSTDDFNTQKRKIAKALLYQIVCEVDSDIGIGSQ